MTVWYKYKCFWISWIISHTHARTHARTHTEYRRTFKFQSSPTLNNIQLSRFVTHQQRCKQSNLDYSQNHTCVSQQRKERKSEATILTPKSTRNWPTNTKQHTRNSNSDSKPVQSGRLLCSSIPLHSPWQGRDESSSYCVCSGGGISVCEQKEKSFHIEILELAWAAAAPCEMLSQIEISSGGGIAWPCRFIGALVDSIRVGFLWKWNHPIHTPSTL